MARVLALLFAGVVTMLAAAGDAQAQTDMRDIMGGGPNFFNGGGGGSSPIQRTTVNFTGAYAPGTILHQHLRTPALSRARQRPGAALRHRRRPRRLPLERNPSHHTAKKEWPSWTPPSQDAWRVGPTCRGNMAWRHRQSARCAGQCIWESTLYRIPRLQRATRRSARPVVRMLPHDQ